MLLHPPLVSVIVLNYNQAALTCGLLKSFHNHCRYPRLQLILVDNGSAEDPAPSCKEIYPNLEVIYSDFNKGYAGGMNLGLEKAKGDFVLLLNNDLICKSDIIWSMMEVFDHYPDAGLVSPMIMQFNAPGRIEYAGYTRISNFTGRNRAIGHGEKDIGIYHDIISTAYGHGAAMMVSRKALIRTGHLSETYFLYYEEMDWSEQFRKSGYRVFVQPAAKVYHIGSATTGDHSPLKTYYLARNRIIFMKRNRTSLQYRSFIIYLIMMSVPIKSATLFLSGKATELKAYWKGLSDGLTGNLRAPEWLIKGVVGKG